MFWDMLLKLPCAHELPGDLVKGRFGFSISKLSSDAKAGGSTSTLLVIKDQESMEVSLYMMAGSCCGAVLVAYWSSISLGSTRQIPRH